MPPAGNGDGGDGGGAPQGKLDLAILGGKPVKPGDEVRLEVVSVDEDMQSFTVAYPKEQGPKASAIDTAASKFDNQSSDEGM